MSIVMGTAGHIDHGKTSLVRALTGTDCDRLEEEKRRGITIELGFAFMPLPDGTRLGIVDVPGHEKFIRNMVAGATGIDFVLLVIAADEGIMPQTREHLEICSLLGIQHGIVAMTKIDMVDEELLALAREEIAAYMEGTFLAGCPIIPVSSVTGAGVDDVRKAVIDQVASVRSRYHSDIARLPIDRVFSLKGHGTVVTGTLLSGKLDQKDEVVLVPSGKTSRIKSIQNHGVSVETALAGHRISLNLPDVEVADVARGEIVAHEGKLFPSKKWLLKLSCLSSSPRALRHGAEIHFHHGTKEVSAKLHFVRQTPLQPGGTALAEVCFAEPMSAIFNDRCVIRAYSPLRTVAGGIVLNPLDQAQRIQKISDENRALLMRLDGMEDAVRVEAQIFLAGENGLSWNELEILTCLESRRLDKAVQALSQAGKVFCFHRESRSLLAGNFVEPWEKRMLDRAADFHRADPLARGMARGYLLSGMGKAAPTLLTFILNRLLKSGRLVADGDVLRSPTHKVTLIGSQSELNEAVLRLIAQGGSTPPVLKELCASLEVTEKELLPMLKVLIQENKIVKVSPELYYANNVIVDIKNTVTQWFSDHSDLTPADFKTISGLTRKYAIPLLEYLDGSHFTLRIGNQRVLRNARAAG